MSIPYRILVVDYSDDRRKYLVGRLKERLKDIEVTPLETQPPDGSKDQNYETLSQLKNAYDLVIAHIGGNPSGYECLRTFKEHNPTGKAILFTKGETVPIDKFEGLKLADAIFRRAQDDKVVFANDDGLLDLVARIRELRAFVPTLGLPDKVTLQWLFQHVTVPQWSAAAGIVVAAFIAGVSLGGNPLIQSLIGGKQSPAGTAVSSPKASGP